MEPLSGNQRPNLLTYLINMSLVLRLPRKMHLCRSSSNVPRLQWFLEMPQNPHILLAFNKVHNPLRLPRKSTSERPELLVFSCIFNILTSKYASRDNSVHFSNSKSGPNLVCFIHVDFEMCFAPHRRALFRSFSTSQLPKVVRTWCVVCILTSICASRPNSMQFFISHLARWLCTRRFSEPTFRPSGATNHWKTQGLATFLPFRAPGSSFF